LVAVEGQLLWWIKSQQQLKSSVHSFRSSMFSSVLIDIWWLAADTEIFLHGNPIFKHLHLRYASPSCITFLLNVLPWPYLGFSILLSNSAIAFIWKAVNKHCMCESHTKIYKDVLNTNTGLDFSKLIIQPLNWEN
jgi:hypothetical protein